MLEVGFHVLILNKSQLEDTRLKFCLILEIGFHMLVLKKSQVLDIADRKFNYKQSVYNASLF